MIVFVTGASASGKTYYRRKMWPDAICIDILDYQIECRKQYDGYRALLEAENNAVSDLLEAIRKMKKGDVVIYEAPLSSRERRKDYANRVRQALIANDKEDEKIICVFCEPKEEDVEIMIRKKTKIDPSEVANGNNRLFYNKDGTMIERYVKAQIEYAKEWRRKTKRPSKEEGFDEVMIVVPELE